jgi:hypothetical protein
MIEEESVGRLRLDIGENMAVQAEGRAEEVRNLRPDVTFEIQEDFVAVFEILEFSCPAVGRRGKKRQEGYEILQCGSQLSLSSHWVQFPSRH